MICEHTVNDSNDV